MSAQLGGFVRRWLAQPFDERSALRIYEKDLLNSGFFVQAPKKIKHRHVLRAGHKDKAATAAPHAPPERDTGRHNAARPARDQTKPGTRETNTGQATRRDQKREHRRKTQGTKKRQRKKHTRRKTGTCTKFPLSSRVRFPRVPEGGRVSRFTAARVRARTHAICAADLGNIRLTTRLGAHMPPSEDEDEVAVCDESSA